MGLRKTPISNKRQYQRYFCHRGGRNRSRAKGKRHTKMQGSCKIEGCCPAFIKAHMSESGVKVTYVSHHVGHGAELQHLRLSPNQRRQIAGMIHAGIQFDEILDKVRNSLNSIEIARLHL